ncbi:MAG: DUF2628 domain-containing protein [Mesorhizobium sp.]
MAVYVVMEPPGRGHEADETSFVRDGFSWFGFLVPPLWLAWHRRWIEAGLAFVAIALIAVAAETFGMPLLGAPLILLVMLYVGLEGQALRLAAMARNGWRQWGVVVADSLDDADLRYATEAGAPPQEPPSEPRLQPESSLARPARPGPAIGLVPFSGKR